MSDAAVIVVVEDEASIRRFVRQALEAEGYRVVEAETGERGLIEAGTRRPDLMVLDLGLPDRDGVEVVRDLRAWSQLPVLVLSARTSEQEKIAALDAGADDYLTKPFSTGELAARVRAHLRRRRGGQGGTGDNGAAVVAFGRNRVDPMRRSVERDGAALHLTPIEFRLLGYLIANQGCVLTHRELLRNVWGPSHADDSHYLRIFMSQLRKKLEDDPARPRHLLTEAGVGYRFCVD